MRGSNDGKGFVITSYSIHYTKLYDGLLVREFSCFERAEKADAVVFDKTGTLTVGRYALLDIHTNGKILSEQALAP